MKKFSFLFLSMLLMVHASCFIKANESPLIKTEEEGASVDDELQSLLNDPDLFNDYMEDSEKMNASYRNRPEWLMKIQAYVDSLCSRYPNQTEKIIEKLAVIDRYIRDYSGGHLSFLMIAPWVGLGLSTGAAGVVVLYCLIKS